MFKTFHSYRHKGGGALLVVTTYKVREVSAVGIEIHNCKMYIHTPCIHLQPFLAQGVSSRVHGEQLYCRPMVCRGYNIISLVLGRLGTRLRWH